MPSLSVRRLYQDNQKKIQLSWIAGSSNSDSKISLAENNTTRSFVGHFNFVHPNKIQVIGLSEYEFIQNKSVQDKFGFFLEFITELNINLIIIGNNLPIIPQLKDFCTANSVPLMHSKVESPKIVDVLQIYLQRALAPSTTMHGVFLNVFEMGTLICGHSGLGKSELALELISRGHSLVADDVVKIYKTGPESLEGRCPKLLREFLEVRGLGIINIRTMFGETAVRVKKALRLIIQLVNADDDYMKNLDRLSMRIETQKILDVSVRKITIPVGAGRNIAVLTEAAVRNYILQLRGLDSMQEFLERHNTAMSTNNEILLDDINDSYDD
ncbi:MAG: HPr kinase/phosphorylase [Neisseriaceae bacterium]|nr:MAG: HPr kinase/phosphorylase [Neisseriaceae bacterium]